MRLRMWGLWAAGALLFASTVPEARADSYRDEKLGYSFSSPSHWNQVPVEAGNSLVAQFNSRQEYEWNDPKNNFWTRHQPWLKVIVIPLSAKEVKGATVEKTEDGVKIRRVIPWTDLKEYLDQTCRNIGGFHFSGEDETTLNGLKVRRFEITVDKNVNGERRVYGWEFQTEDAYYGLVAEILAQHEKKLKPEIFSSFSTFKAFARTGRLPTATVSDDDIVITDPKKEAEKEVTAEDLKKKRDDAFTRTLGRIKENLPAGWTIIDGKNFTAVSHAEPKFARELLGQAEALRAWLEGELGYVGSGYVGRVVIRICADRQEYDALQQSKGWIWDAPEVLTFKDRDGWSDWNIRGLNSSIYRIWMRDKNQRLAWGLPQWLGVGLPNFIEQARMKSGRLVFRSDTWDSVAIKNLRRAGTLLKPKDFFSMTSQELWSGQTAYVQTQFFIDFLLEGAASQSPKYKNVLSDYLKNLIFSLDTQKDDPADAGKQPQNEAEEADMVRRRQDAWRAQERETLDTLIAKTFSGWTEKEWEAFNALYTQDLK